MKIGIVFAAAAVILQLMSSASVKIEDSNVIASLSTDCVTLTVFSGTNCTAQTPCPVIYYIFGTAFYGGQARDHEQPEIQIDSIASKGIVFVLPSFRVGTLSFWSDGSPDAMGNNGLRDMVQGLKWVQKEIKSFGGDPNRVTFMGHSSGSMSVALLSLTKVTEGLINQVAMLGGPSLITNCDDVSKDFAIRTGCATEKTWKSINRKFNRKRKIRKCLQEIPFERVLSVQEDMINGGIEICLAAGTFDGPNGLFPLPLEELRSSRRAYPLLLGDTQYELGNFLNGLTNTAQGDSDAFLIQLCELYAKGVGGFKFYKEICQTCPAYFDEKIANRSTSVKEVFDSMWLVGMWQEAASMRKAGSPVYLYSFDYVKPGLQGTFPNHGDELKYVGIETPINFTEGDIKIAGYFNPLFINFVKNGNPNLGTEIDPKFERLESPERDFS